MTLYARGYRPYDRDARKGSGFRERGLRFSPIVAEGWRDAQRSRAYRFFGGLIACIAAIQGFLLYFQSNVLRHALEGFRLMGMKSDLTPSDWLEATIANFHDWSWIFVVLVTLFVGAGLVADDLRSRALPLYLSRPIRPLDYYLGKLLIPVSVLAVLELLPMLFLVGFAVLMQPSEEMFPFLAQQGDVVGAILAYFAVTAVAYSSLVLLYSAWTSRRIAALVLGAVTLLGGEVVRNAVRRLEGSVADLLRASSLMADTKVVLFTALGRDASQSDWASHPTLGRALLALLLVTALGAVVVLRRARSVEVTG